MGEFFAAILSPNVPFIRYALIAGILAAPAFGFVDPMAYLFGNILLLSAADLAGIVVLDVVVLVITLLTLPAATAGFFARSLKRLMIVASILSAFGAVDGVLVVTQTGNTFDAQLVPNPAGTPDGVRTGTVYAHPRLEHFVGNLGDGLVKVDPFAKTSTAYALPTRPWRFGIDRSGHYIVVLGFDGVLYVLDPSTNRILEIHLDDADIEEVFTVEIDGTITSISLVVTDGIIH